MALVLIAVVVLWLVPWAVANSIGKAKGRAGQGFVLGMFLGWLGVLAIGMMPPLNPASMPARPVRAPDSRLPRWWR
jgi:hypothetical protein